jgi:bifunctional N-acetylglucosamine-1-phosphate-uridyltransferase/glucosamine-1-phosphate-acetyltransferase GlmU-like protein
VANAQGELYLTDIIAMAVKDGKTIASVIAKNDSEVAGVNDKVQLAELERVLQQNLSPILVSGRMRANVPLGAPFPMTASSITEFPTAIHINTHDKKKHASTQKDHILSQK